MYTNRALVNADMTQNTESPTAAPVMPDIPTDVKERIKALDDLRPFPATAAQILSECQNGDADVRTITQLIECDPALASKVLSIANSPLYGSPRPISTVSHAIVVIGFRAVSQLALSIAAGEVFSEGNPQVLNHLKKTFTQSLACASMARLLARETAKANPDEAFLCGVMHDVGKLVFFDAVPEEYSQLLQQFPNGEMTTVEQQRFGSDHAGIGKKCGAQWGLPPQINLAIQNHHLPFQELTHDLSRVILAANYFSRQWEVGFEAAEFLPTCEALEQEFADLNVDEIKPEAEELFDAVKEVCGVSA